MSDTSAPSSKATELRNSALDYHRYPRPGKFSIRPTKPMSTQWDLSLAYSPGVAAACEEIARDPLTALEYTTRANMVAVITNGTAVLGLGNIGPLAAKPVMEGKSVLFKKFANVDSVDVEIDETDIDKFVDIVAALEPTYGGINLEDIKAPECFEIERRLSERMNIPVFHDDQHGTAIVASAAVFNWLHLTGRDASDVKLVANGAGASAIACLSLMVDMGLKRENIIVCDRSGTIHKGRNDLTPEKEIFASDTNARTLAEALDGANIFLGLSGPNVLDRDMVSKMADAPLIMAMANPTPEIMPEEAKAAKPNAVICTGRSDYPNQVNNVLCFPYIFRGALDVGATAITQNMKLACVKALAELTRKEAAAEVAAVYDGETLEFGPEYLIPKPFDPRLIVELPSAVARAAMEDGVASKPIENWEDYLGKLKSITYRTSMVMRPIFEHAQHDPQRVVFCEGEDERVLRAAQTVLDENVAKPILIGRRSVVETRIKRLSLRLRPDENFELVDPESDERYRDYWQSYHKIMERRGVTPDDAKTIVRTNTTVIGALMVDKGDADAMVCGTAGNYRTNKDNVLSILGLKPGVDTPGALTSLIMPRGTFFFCDTHVNPDPTAEQLAELTILAAEEIQRYGIKPNIALLSHANFGSNDDPSAMKMRQVLEQLRIRAPHLDVDGEMHADTALSQEIRDHLMPNSTLKGPANLFVMPDCTSANIAYNFMKVMADGISVGPVLLGVGRPAYILTSSVSTRGILNIAAHASVAAQVEKASGHALVV